MTTDATPSTRKPIKQSLPHTIQQFVKHFIGLIASKDRSPLRQNSLTTKAVSKQESSRLCFQSCRLSVFICQLPGEVSPPYPSPILLLMNAKLFLLRITVVFRECIPDFLIHAPVGIWSGSWIVIQTGIRRASCSLILKIATVDTQNHLHLKNR